MTTILKIMYYKLKWPVIPYLIIIIIASLFSVACTEEVEPEIIASVEPEQATVTPNAGDPTTESTLSASTTALVETAQYQENECPFDMPDGYTLDCGYLTVPENRTKQDSPNIELAVAILRTQGNNVQPDPLIYLTGGPGGSALVDFLSEPDAWTDYPFTQNRDLIFIDQRGTGFSTPSLNCIEFDDGDTQSDTLDYDCHDRLAAEGIDLTAYNTPENAADIAALVRVLDYENWNILSVSYGTRLALAIMRYHPEGIRSVVLDSPFPPNARTAEEESINTFESINLLFENCAKDPDCQEAYPDLETVFLETVERLNEEPEADVYGDDLVLAMEQALTAGSDLIALLPLMVYDAADGYFELYDEIVLGEEADSFARFLRQDEDDIYAMGDSEGMYHSVICHDEFSFSDYNSVEAGISGVIPETLQPALFNTTASQFDICDVWEAGTAPISENEAVYSDIPTLILVGEYDPATPPKWGRLTAETLDNAFFYEFPGAGHSLLSSDNCAIQMTDQFLNEPTVEPDNCLDNIPDIQFLLP